ncbi:MAG TPA: glycosyltransferase family 2 protein, partial [Actinobacteria bacterium]|nr:glycosyltransferase family 2 protein [Actinomycetota bacterium]
KAAGARVLEMPINTGVGGALRAGFRYAVEHGYRRVVQVDADLQHPPEAIPTLLEPLDAGAELVIGSRFADGYEVGFPRRLAMRILAGIVRLRTGAVLDDVTSGFRGIAEPLLSRFAYRFPADYLGDTVEAILIAHAAGASIRQVPVPMAPRRAGEATPPLRAGAHLARLFVALVAGKPTEMAR